MLSVGFSFKKTTPIRNKMNWRQRDFRVLVLGFWLFKVASYLPGPKGGACTPPKANYDPTGTKMQIPYAAKNQIFSDMYLSLE